ncbi:MarR family winged helix-turn-helix transcriptional regulator [Streptantibioticus silvisoli]|uniref:MarR family winged helix-turn-helix transcriptional regulator n=1 Tax=Streptantibioticus silvisoli TaxID=2705255 RepID=A0ABT6VY30_9ACTN|nr:MarR family winged helix-turn-helix transcriptional regulator [Streptantibioticus silvisoli]MDI5963386.1 MarR family winged helix-turn-helix transcriptional regulator [Streptantibioticus silvisoli]
MPPKERQPAGDPDGMDLIEFQTALLVRNFELLNRRREFRYRLDRAEYLVLRTLDARGPMSLNELAAILGVAPSTVGRQVAVLRASALVVSEPAPQDKRRCVITPTDEGLRRMDDTRSARSHDVAALLADWSPEDVRLLGAMFDKYNRAVSARYLTPDASPGTD